MKKYLLGVLLLLIPFFSIDAASLSVSLKCAKTVVKAGDTVSCTVSATTNDLVGIQFSYDLDGVTYSSFTTSYNFDTKNSIYTSAHLTTKHSNGDWNTNTGAWVGYTHNFDKFSISAEVQQNIPFDRKLKPNDTMINVMATIPI